MIMVKRHKPCLGVDQRITPSITGSSRTQRDKLFDMVSDELSSEAWKSMKFLREMIHENYKEETTIIILFLFFCITFLSTVLIAGSSECSDTVNSMQK